MRRKGGRRDGEDEDLLCKGGSSDRLICGWEGVSVRWRKMSGRGTFVR